MLSADELEEYALPAEFRPGVDIDGRPDWADFSFGWTKAKKFKKFIHTNGREDFIVHRVRTVDLRWYEGRFNWLQRLASPNMYAKTFCGYTFFLWPSISGVMCNKRPEGREFCGKCMKLTIVRNRH